MAQVNGDVVIDLGFKTAISSSGKTEQRMVAEMWWTPKGRGRTSSAGAFCGKTPGDALRKLAAWLDEHKLAGWKSILDEIDNGKLVDRRK